MAKLEDSEPNAALRGILPDCLVSLLDGDRFEGRFRDGVHKADVSDLMRRMVKERLFKFNGKRLFPPRIAHTVPYRLSDAEARLYKQVTEYVREELNRAEALHNDKRAATVGFALTILQRRVDYVRRPFHREPDFGVTSVNYDFAKLLARAEAPS